MEGHFWSWEASGADFWVLLLGGRFTQCSFSAIEGLHAKLGMIAAVERRESFGVVVRRFHLFGLLLLGGFVASFLEAVDYVSRKY